MSLIVHNSIILIRGSMASKGATEEKKWLMKTRDIIQLLKEREGHFRQRYFLTSLLLYGSYALDKQKMNSDIDFLYTTRADAPMTLSRLQSLENFMKDILNIEKIELVNRHQLNPIVKSNIEGHVISIF